MKSNALLEECEKYKTSISVSTSEQPILHLERENVNEKLGHSLRK